MTHKGIIMGRRAWNGFLQEAPHNGMSHNPICEGLLNAVWGSPFQDIFGNLPTNSITTRPAHNSSGGVPGSAVTGQVFMSYEPIVTNGQCTLVALVRLTSTSQLGINISLNDSANNDTGLSLGVGATAPNANGNNVCGIRGGINFDNSGLAIGTGWHMIGKTTDGAGGNEGWWVDGVRGSITGTGASWGLTNGIPRVVMMNHQTGGTVQPSAGNFTHFGAIWNRVLSSAEMDEMYQNPYCLVKG